LKYVLIISYYTLQLLLNNFKQTHCIQRSLNNAAPDFRKTTRHTGFYGGTTIWSKLRGVVKIY